MTHEDEKTIGCDLGDRLSEVCVLDTAGNVEERTSVHSTRKEMTSFFTRRAAHVVIEVGSHSRWVSALLTDLGHRVTIANPRRLKLISESNNKTDRHDAELLARLGRADVNLLAPIAHRKPETQADLAVAKARDLLVRVRTKLICHVRSTIKTLGERLPTGTPATFSRKTRLLVPVALKAALEPIYETLDRVNDQIREYDQTIERLARRHPDVEVLSQINGVGTLTALVYMLTLEDKTRFRRSRMVGAFLGMRPRKSKSGAGDPQLRITKTGDPFVRRLLVNGASYMLGRFGKDSDLRRWGLELAKRGGKNAKKRATVAVARKVAVLMHRLWVTVEVYEPLGYRSHRMEEPVAA